jgi:DNA-binding transcriptional ArsR family regulator
MSDASPPHSTPDSPDHAGGELASLCWGELLGVLVHPTKVLIIEALRWIDHPLSATEFERIFGEKSGLHLSNLSYHVSTLAKAGILRQVKKRRVRGAWERFYFFASAVED